MNLKLLAEDVNDLFGTVNPPQGMNFGGNNPVEGLGKFISFGLRLFIIISAFFLFIYLLWGAFDWISSSGEKEKITKAQNKITNALIGMLLIFIVLVVFNVLTGELLGIINVNPDGSWQFQLPTLGN